MKAVRVTGATEDCLQNLQQKTGSWTLLSQQPLHRQIVKARARPRHSADQALLGVVDLAQHHLAVVAAFYQDQSHPRRMLGTRHRTMRMRATLRTTNIVVAIQLAAMLVLLVQHLQILHVGLNQGVPAPLLRCPPGHRGHTQHARNRIWRLSLMQESESSKQLQQMPG